MEYVWYIVNDHHGWGFTECFFSRPMCHVSPRKQSPSECSWMIPTWETFERASQ